MTGYLTHIEDYCDLYCYLIKQEKGLSEEVLQCQKSIL